MSSDEPGFGRRGEGEVRDGRRKERSRSPRRVFPSPSFRMRQPGPQGEKAISIFLKDISETYTRMESRVVEMNAETAARKASGEPSEGEEQIQLVAEGGATVSFNVPDGPPPDVIELEGEGTEGMDPVEVQKYFMQRWNIFEGMKEEMKAALKKESLEEVNKVLGRMGLEEAEKAVSLSNAGRGWAGGGGEGRGKGTTRTDSSFRSALLVAGRPHERRRNPELPGRRRDQGRDQQGRGVEGRRGWAVGRRGRGGRRERRRGVGLMDGTLFTI